MSLKSVGQITQPQSTIFGLKSSLELKTIFRRKFMAAKFFRLKYFFLLPTDSGEPKNYSGLAVFDP